MYEKKENKYFDNVRKDLLETIPKNSRGGIILEIGAGSGETLLYAKKNNYASKVYGIELVKLVNTKQDSPEIEKFCIGNIETMLFPFEDIKFDIIIMGDVLEHLINPYLMLKKLANYLTKDGMVIASIPNIREWDTMKTIFLKGDFKYVDSGILDKTHLRFFTKKNMIQLFENNGFRVLEIKSKNNTTPLKYFIRLKLFKFMLKIFFPEFLTEQYIITANLKN